MKLLSLILFAMLTQAMQMPMDQEFSKNVDPNAPIEGVF